MPLSRVLIANRGEIAVRVIRACADAGLTSIAVYSEEDRDAVHVRMADEAFTLGASGAAETYLNAERLLEVAAHAGADAVHPGYGFLAESAEFARRVARAGLTWIGPPPAAIAALGDKVRARAIARAVGANLLPGTDEPVATPDAIRAFADIHGFPLVVKAAHGGGGRGMRVVRSPGEIADAFEAAAREAGAAFGRHECFIERYLDTPRHVETQCLADSYGTVAILATRDCSIQRRHQKLVEEAPAPCLTDSVREDVARTSRAILRRVGYVGAATVEFLVWTDDAGPSDSHAASSGLSVAFLEVNTRLQVEHPVTEEVTGIDLVREQFRIAAGEPLGYDAIEPMGHAIEFRINGEDPARGFTPSPGTVTHLRLPGGPGVRVDFGFQEGDRVSESFDSLLGKVIVRGRDRREAWARARRALREVEVHGVATVVPLLRALASNPVLTGDSGHAAGFAIHTRFVETELARLLPESAESDSEGMVPEVASPVPQELQATGRVVVEVGGKRFEVVLPAGLIRAATPTLVRRAPRRVAPTGSSSANGAVAAPMQGVIVRTLVGEGDVVEAGQVLVVLEAMKMEQPLTAPRAGTVRALNADVGARVAAGTVLLTLEENGAGEG
ncbi:MAG: biotin/lipoyl-binding protein [Bifidobacteriaceae bacterium]|jgi:acetyl-CoA/propionyl-CoA carboxylase biotin carboxyl carrier protein|nr:biotin/lipoyl-binding protein [Bifidobacteriaceae bacterium]